MEYKEGESETISATVEVEVAKDHVERPDYLKRALKNTIEDGTSPHIQVSEVEIDE